SLSLLLRPGGSVTRAVDAVRRLGFTIEDTGAEQAGLAVTLLSAVFLLVSLLILLVAGVNIAHTFFRAVSERRRDLGVMRAVGPRPQVTGGAPGHRADKLSLDSGYSEFAALYQGRPTSARVPG